MKDGNTSPLVTRNFAGSRGRCWRPFDAPGENLAVRFYRRTPVTPKHLVVPYKEITETDGFVLTAYFAARVPEWREQLWKR